MAPRILLVHNDKKTWATERRARVLSNIWHADICHADNVSEGYDVIHFLYSGGLTKSKKFILKNKDKVFTTLASHRSLEGRWDNKDDFEEIYRNTQCCVCHNPTLLSKYNDLYGDNAVFIPNGVDEIIFNRDFKVGYVGAKDSAEHKGLYIIQKACNELGIELKKAEGEYSNMIDFYRGIDCLAVASESEGCNNPTLEALAMNKPVISTDTGIADQLDGVFLVQRNVESIMKALRKLSGRIQIIEEYTWDKIAKQYMDMYVRYISSP